MADLLRIGEPTTTGLVVKEVLGQSPIASVYITEDGQLRWEYLKNKGQLPGEHQVAVSDFDRLMREIKLYIPQRHRDDQYKLLGKCLHRALDSSPASENESFFAGVVASNSVLAAQAVRFSYVLYCLIALAITIATVFSFNKWIADTLVWQTPISTGLFGAVGATFSVLHRIKKLEIDWRASKNVIAIEAGARILVGYFFGVFFYLACQADLILGAIKDNPSAIFVFATIAGFSERFIPQLIEKLEGRASESD